MTNAQILVSFILIVALTCLLVLVLMSFHSPLLSNLVSRSDIQKLSRKDLDLRTFFFNAVLYIILRYDTNPSPAEEMTGDSGFYTEDDDYVIDRG